MVVVVVGGGMAVIGADSVNSVIRDYLKQPKSTKTGVMTWRSRLVIDPHDVSPEAAHLRPCLKIPIAPHMAAPGSSQLCCLQFSFKTARYHGPGHQLSWRQYR
jgi:2-polyprenyl-6-methoxyphenol hydroxylase-like FAD-dependent oxidoreductase